MARASGWQKFARTGSFMWSLSIDDLRRMRTKGLQVRVDQSEMRRGDDFAAFVVITEPERFGQLEVGVVCTEHYDTMRASGHDSGPRRQTSTAIEHETWQPVHNVTGEHLVRLKIPLHAPYSYAGTCLCFTWEVVARGHRRGALDARACQEIRVLP